MDDQTMIRIAERARRAQAATRELRDATGAQRRSLPTRESRMEADAMWIEARIEREHSRAIAVGARV